MSVYDGCYVHCHNDIESVVLPTITAWLLLLAIKFINHCVEPSCGNVTQSHHNTFKDKIETTPAVGIPSPSIYMYIGIGKCIIETRSGT